MLILILTDVQYSQNVVFGFEKGLNVQNHTSSDSHHPIKKSAPPCKIYHPSLGGFLSLPLNAIWKTLASEGRWSTLTNILINLNPYSTSV